MKSGFVAIVGRPNVGKSTLLNTVLDIKVSAVSPKPQTTRQRIQGIANGPEFQILFLDTPGLLTPRYPLQKLMAQEIAAALKDADLVLWLVEPALPSEPLEPGAEPARVVVAVNKIDTVEKPALLPVIGYYSSRGFSPVIPVSALRRDGIDVLLAALQERLPDGEPFYPPDQLTTQPEKFFAAEFIREALFGSYGDEIPYSTIVEITEFREQAGRKDLIRATVYVERDSQKGILIGRQGTALKRLGTRARARIEAFLERPVYLELHVKVKEGWRRDETFIRERFRG